MAYDWQARGVVIIIITFYVKTGMNAMIIIIAFYLCENENEFSPEPTVDNS